LIHPEARAVTDEIVASLAALPEQSTDPVRRVRRTYSAQLRRASAGEIHAIADVLLAPPVGHMRRFVAYELIAAHPAARDALDVRRVEQLGNGVADWGAVDMFGALIAGPAWRAAHIADSDVERWARSPDRWWRRAALVSTTALNVRGTRDPARTLRIAGMLINDRDDMVIKAMSWALRALAQRDPAAARAFINENWEQVAPRVRREVTSKLDTGLKQGRHSRT
jgi:3-methyladenine DNA glycosylase AlkD